MVNSVCKVFKKLRTYQSSFSIKLQEVQAHLDLLHSGDFLFEKSRLFRLSSYGERYCQRLADVSYKWTTNIATASKFTKKTINTQSESKLVNFWNDKHRYMAVVVLFKKHSISFREPVPRNIFDFILNTWRHYKKAKKLKPPNFTFFFLISTILHI